VLLPKINGAIRQVKLCCVSHTFLTHTRPSMSGGGGGGGGGGSQSLSAAVVHMAPEGPPHLDAALASFWGEESARAASMLARGEPLPVVDLPVTRIRRGMRADPAVAMVAAEVPVVFARAAELFIQELGIRCVGWRGRVEVGATRWLRAPRDG
jgi:hypothetical protein